MAEEQENKSATAEEEGKKAGAVDTPKVHMWCLAINICIVNWEKGSFLGL